VSGESPKLTMINRIFFISTLFISSLLLIQCSPPQSSHPCRSGDPKETAYIWRDENRCEGISEKRPASGGGINFISLTTSAITTVEDYEEKLHLHIPKFSDSNDLDVAVSSKDKPYQLDNIKSFKTEASALTFSWSTYILKKKKIVPKSLRALAFYQDGSEPVFLPVTLGKSSVEYKFVFYYDYVVENFTFEIRRNGKSVHTCGPITNQKGEIICEWKPNKAPKGRYQLKYVAKLKQFGKPSKPDEGTKSFEHNPAWLSNIDKKQ
jgi:hypothetical protein